MIELDDHPRSAERSRSLNKLPKPLVWCRPMRAFLIPIVATAVAAGGLTAAGVLSVTESPALAAKAKAKASSKRSERKPARQTTGFEHQQCTVQNPCSTRNDW